MTVSEILTQTWGTVVAEASQAEGYYHRRISLACVWPAHAGIHRPTDARILILETELKLVRGLRLKDETKGYSIDFGPDEAGRSDRANFLRRLATSHRRHRRGSDEQGFDPQPHV